MSEDSFFGSIDLDDIDTTFKAGTYRLKLENIQDREATVEDNELKRRFKIFNFVIDDDNPEIESFNGEQVKGVFLNYWPGINTELYKSMTPTEKSNFRKALNLYKTLARAFGAEEDVIAAGKVQWDDYEDIHVFGRLYPNKQSGDPTLQQDSIVHEDSVEL